MGNVWIEQPDGSTRMVWAEDLPPPSVYPAPAIIVSDAVRPHRATRDQRFNQCIPWVLQEEGAFVDNPNDPGGATNHGISLRYARTMGSMFDLAGDGDVDRDDILRVTPPFAAMVYRQWFWADIRGDELPAGVDYCLFDLAVNSGGGRAIKSVQNALRMNQVDGFLGPATMSAILSADPPNLVIAICAERFRFLKTLKTWKHFGNGWTNRIKRVQARALSIAS